MCIVYFILFCYSIISISNSNLHIYFTGSGLGLWIAKGITILHGGSIGVENEEEIRCGSTFYLELPLIDGKNENESENENENTQSREWNWNNPKNNIDKNCNTITIENEKKINHKVDKFQKTKIIPIENKPITEENTTSEMINKSNDNNNIKENNENKENKSSSPKFKFQSQSQSHSFSPLHILIVDDVKSNRKLLERTLVNQGHKCDVTCDGKECVDLMATQLKLISSKEKEREEREREERYLYDLILMDSEMPNMNGPTATKLIREMGFEQLIIIGVTGNMLPEDVEMFINHGADAVLGKPLKMELLWKEYNRIIQIKNKDKK